jgi:hypothetical protein
LFHLTLFLRCILQAFENRLRLETHDKIFSTQGERQKAPVSFRKRPSLLLAKLNYRHTHFTSRQAVNINFD